MPTVKYEGGGSITIHLSETIELRATFQTLKRLDLDIMAEIGQYDPNTETYRSLDNINIFNALRRHILCVPCSCDFTRYKPIFDKYGIPCDRHENFCQCIAAAILCN